MNGKTFETFINEDQVLDQVNEQNWGTIYRYKNAVVGLNKVHKWRTHVVASCLVFIR